MCCARLRCAGGFLLLLANLGLTCDMQNQLGVNFELTIAFPGPVSTVPFPMVHIEAAMEAAPDRVTRVVYLLNGGPEVDANAPIESTGSAGDQYLVEFTVAGLREGNNEIIVRAYDAAGRSAGASVSVRYAPQEVVLDKAVGNFPAGTHIALTRITNGHVAEPHACSERHLHAATSEGIKIDGRGPFTDPNPTACGFGPVVYP
ncbi:hypothetical protein RAS1_35520 [Phycisphaerae bacterium RAS1]|nr:hypothetical protein RAS1_35520 [Phycisphaerae bacterium RAS1]